MYEAMAIISVVLVTGVILVFLGFKIGTQKSWGLPIDHLECGVKYRIISTDNFNYLELRKNGENKQRIHRIDKERFRLPKDGKWPSTFIAVEYKQTYFIFPTQPHFVLNHCGSQNQNGVVTLTEMNYDNQLKLQQYYQIGKEWIPIDLPIEEPASLSEAVWTAVKNPSKKLFGLLRSKLAKDEA